jgi:hypothetical protein
MVAENPFAVSGRGASASKKLPTGERYRQRVHEKVEAHQAKKKL